MNASLLDMEANRKKLQLFQQTAETLLRALAVRGFYGEGAIRIVVQDGVIQEIREERRRKVR